MDVANELLDAIEIIVDKKIRENTAQIYFGVCKEVSGDSCVMSINGKNNTIHFYGSAPIVGLTYRVFVPNGNMSMAFAITGNDDRKGLYYSNPNLLDNWYFGNPVNQRGQTSFTDAGYGIDRWKLVSGGSGTCWMLIENDGITIGTDTGYGVYFAQIIDPSVVKAIAGKTVTISVLAGEKSGNFTGNILINGSWNDYWTIEANDVSTKKYTVPANATSMLIQYAEGGSGAGTCKLKAAKLELGTKQTLAHQDANGNWVLNEIPDYGEQLLRCQRYFQTFATESLRPTDALDFRPVMRTNPALSTIAVGGKTLYTASADL